MKTSLSISSLSDEGMKEKNQPKKFNTLLKAPFFFFPIFGVIGLDLIKFQEASGSGNKHFPATANGGFCSSSITAEIKLTTPTAD